MENKPERLMEYETNENLSFEINKCSKIKFIVLRLILNDCRRSRSQVMADSANANNLVKNRVIKSRPNTREEKLKQQKAWKKKKRERERARNAISVPQQDGNAGKSSNSANDVSDRKTKPSSSLPKPTSDLRLKDTKQRSRQPTMASSRGAVMLQMARGVVNFAFTQSKPSRSSVSLPRNARHANERVIRQSTTDLKELDTDHLQHLSEHAVGSGSYGQCYRARYRGIEVIVKKISHDHTAEGKDRARRNLVHEANVISALGDHARLPMLFGVITHSEPLCMVTQFHCVGNESVTLHEAAKQSFLTPKNSVEIFQELCSAVKHVHSRGYLHNDIKANNVVLEKNTHSHRKFIQPCSHRLWQKHQGCSKFHDVVNIR